MSKVLFLRNNKAQKQDNLFLLNYASNLQNLQVPAADTIPTLVPLEKMAVLQNGDTDPYYKIQAIAYPVEGDGGYRYDKAIYTENFFREFVNLTSKNPLPGSKRGHAWMNTGKDASDFYMVGGKVEPRGDGTGVVYFKNYIPKMGYETPNDGFLRDLKVNIINFSLVTRAPRYEVLQDTATKKEFINVLSPGIGNRNDAVELDMGAMQQLTNSAGGLDIDRTALEKARELIRNGKIDAENPWIVANTDKGVLTLTGKSTENIGKNGKVFRSALRAVAARATKQNNFELAEIVNSLEKELLTKRKEQKNMDKEELLVLLKNMLSTGSIGLPDLQNAGMGAMLMTDEGRKALEVVNGFKAIGVNDPLTAYNAAAKALAEGEKVTVEAKLTEKYGAEKLENGSPNKMRVYANRVLKDVKLAELENACAELDKDAIMLEFAGERTDTTTVQNAFTVDKSPLINGDKKPAGAGPRFGGTVKL
jgi:hypothetical protein